MVKGILNMKISWNFCVDISKFNTRHLCYDPAFNLWHLCSCSNI